MLLRSTTEIKKQAPAAVLAGLRNDSPGQSLEYATKLINEAKSYGLSLRDFLRLAVDARLAEGDERAQYAVNDNEMLNGYEAALAFLGLPTRDNLDAGIMLQAAADTFQTFPGTRAMFPEVIDDMVQWKYRQLNFETTEGIVAQKRTISGTELLSTVVEDTQADYEDAIGAVAEGGRIPIHSIRSSQKSVKFYKFGNGYKTTYEFARRASLDILTPYAVRTQRQIERSKTAIAAHVLINGDGVTGAAPVVSAASFDNATNGVGTAVTGKLDFKHLAAWLISRAKAGTPVDTVLGDWDMYIQWLFMFALPTSDKTLTDAEQLARTGFQIGGVPLLEGSVNFKLSSGAPAGQLVGFSRGDTLEELTEAGSIISESERSIQTQEVTYVKTETSGYRLIFGDTRSILNVAF